MTKNAKLKVAEAIQDDVNKGIVRIDSKLMTDMGIRPGDIVEIKGERSTVAIADRSYPGDIGLNIIRMDGIIRRNAKTAIGEYIFINKADVKEAKKVVIAPQRKGVIVRASPGIFKQGLLGRAVVKGDIVSLGGTYRRRNTLSSSPFFDDIFNVLEENTLRFGFGDLKFVVADTKPGQAVIITDLTEVVFNPEAIEIKDEKILEVTYEDIGGLDSEITKIREMVELPLKHPEIFERLGIEPPKGVLLHGAPGTGKTLLAKAVANETNSNFLLINGPEIMCVSGDTPIFTNPNGYIKAEKIFEENGKEETVKNYIVKKLDKPISTYAFENGKIKKAHITHVTKLKSDAYEVKLSDGNDILVSENQPFLVYRNSELVWEPIKNIKKGDFVARLNKLKLPEKSYSIPVNELKKKLNLIKRGSKYAIESRNISRSNFIKLPNKTSPELLEIIGLVVSDGSISKKGDSIGFYNQNVDLIDRFRTLMQKVFGIENFKEKNKGKNLGIIIYSKLLIEYFKLLQFSAENKIKIPAYFFNLPVNEIKSFIRGYFDGDGAVAKLKVKDIEYPTPILYSRNKAFLSQLQSLMLLKMGISSKLGEHKTLKGTRYKLVVRGYDGRLKFLGVKPISEDKKRRLNEINKVIRTKEHENVPHPSVLIQRIKELPYKTYRNKDWYIYKTGNATKYSLKLLYDLALKNGLITKNIQKEFDILMRDDIGWEKVTQINKKREMDLYDFTVDQDSFVGGPYFLMHNSKFYGESEANLRKKFEEAEKNAPSIIFIDEIDAIASKREESRGEVERRVVAQLLAMMDGLKSRGKVVVIAATNIPNSLDPALRRPGRFDREIEIGVPDVTGRLNILKIHTRNMPLAKNVNLKELANITHGFVGADLSALAKEAAMIVLRRVLPDLKLKEEDPIPEEVLKKLMITQKDFKEALKVVRPSALREILVEAPNVTWDDIGGMESAKQELIEAVEWPLKHPDAFKRLGVKPPKGVLIYGAPGTGKTMLAKAIAHESEANFILVKGPELLSKWVGESEKAVREVFKKARQTSPTIIFFDEIDSIASKRGLGEDSRVTERVVNQLLTEMDGLEDLHDVVIIAATNRPDMIDTALLRPGRFDRIILASIPDEKTRKDIFKVHTKEMPLKNVDLDDLAKQTKGYVGADIESVCREAAILALREDITSKAIEMRHFNKALEKVAPSVTEDVESAYEDLQKVFRAARGKEMKIEKPIYMG